MTNYSDKYLKEMSKGMNNTIFLKDCKNMERDEFFEDIYDCIKQVEIQKGRLFFAGNGASAAFSNHMTLDWSKNGGVQSLSLSDSSFLTALANDYDYNDAFLEYFKIYNLNKNDVVITTSSSGNSRNITNILEYCRKSGILSIALSGLILDNKSVDLANYSIFVPCKTYGMVECIHQVFHHLILDQFMNIEEWNKTESQNMNSKNFKL